MTLSSGGQTLDLLPDSFHPVMYTTKRIFGSALIDINGNELTLEWISEHGSREDYFSILKPCIDDSDCEDSRFCNGAATCNAGNCEAGVDPCDDGVYGGTQDTFVMESAPDSNFGAGEHWEWDSQNGTPAGQNYGMIRFDDIVGDTPERIPPGAIVISAYLRLVVWDESAAPPAELRESLVDWNEATETWNSFGGEPGIQADELGVYVADAPVAISTVDIDVTASVQAWAYDPASNRGWIFVPHSNNGVHVHSAEYAVAADRPALIVQVVGSGCDAAAECDDGLACTTDSCNEGADRCDNTPVQSLCDDGNLCTDDSCDPITGCIYTNNVASCDDDGVCTEDDFCSEGTCTGTALDPDEVGNVQMHEGASLTWDDHGAGFTYDVAGGTLADLWADGSVFGAVCLEPGVGEAGFTDPRPDPPAGAGYYYIVRLRGECGPGTYGQSSTGVDRLPLNGCP